MLSDKQASEALHLLHITETAIADTMDSLRQELALAQDKLKAEDAALAALQNKHQEATKRMAQASILPYRRPWTRPRRREPPRRNRRKRSLGRQNFWGDVTALPGGDDGDVTGAGWPFPREPLAMEFPDHCSPQARPNPTAPSSPGSP